MKQQLTAGPSTFPPLSSTYLAVFLAAGMLGFGLVYWLPGEAQQHADHKPAMADMVEPAGHESVILEQAEAEADTVYVCPMNCVPPMEKSGKCPVCGMELVAISAQEHRHAVDAPRLELAPETIRAAGIQVGPVEEKFVATEIRLFGAIEYDPAEQYKATAFAPGVIDNIYVQRAGQAVRKGNPLFDLHSSELFFLEQEFFEILKQFPFRVLCTCCSVYKPNTTHF